MCLVGRYPLLYCYNHLTTRVHIHSGDHPLRILIIYIAAIFKSYLIYYVQ